MEKLSYSTSKVLKIHLALSQYPILADEIRERMREELFKRKIISRMEFDQEVEEKAVQSQHREGLVDPFTQETNETWEKRIRKIREYLTDFYFAFNLPHDLFLEIVKNTLRKQPTPTELVLTFNPELAPWVVLFDKAQFYEQLPPEEFEKFAHHWQEILVVVTKGLISDQLRFIGISRKYFRVDDLKTIVRNRVGRGKIGGKAAGMFLAYKILVTPHPEDKINFSEHIKMPQSFYLGADVFYDFLSKNGLLVYMNQKYKPMEQVKAEVDDIKAAYLQGRFPPKIISQLEDILAQMKGKPLIVRSSSLLEDRFETSFAGKYDSFFCPNQGTDEENLQNLVHAIKQVYASTLSPDAISYRKNMGLVDYDERMAILIQEVVGIHYKNYFFPALAGVALSYNPYRWNQRIKPKAGLLRLVLGLGTRAVDRVAGDYPSIIALSHPLLRPEVGSKEIRHYSQHYIDVLDLAENKGKTLPVDEVISDDFPCIKHLATLDRDGYLQPIVSLGKKIDPLELVFTFEGILKNTNFAPLMRAILKKLEHAYQSPVDIEFAVELEPKYPYPDVKIHLLQCRPLNTHLYMDQVPYPKYVPDEDVIFTTKKWSPSGLVPNIKYIVYVAPHKYNAISDYTTKVEIGRAVSRINRALAGEVFILLGPGRWGSSDISLGVKVTYSDIYNTAILGEIAVQQNDETPEVSYGTHFFQDLVEAKIYPLPIYPDVNGAVFNTQFFEQAENQLAKISPRDERLSPYLQVVDVMHSTGGKVLNVVMDGLNEQAIGYLKKPRHKDVYDDEDA